MMQMGRVLHHYASDHQGMFPPSLQVLGPEYLEYLGWLVCPTALSREELSHDHPKRTDYFYVTGLSERDRSDIALIVENPKNHDGNGGNVLFVDGIAKWFPSQVLDSLLKEPWAQCTRKAQEKWGISDEEIVGLQKRTGIITNGTTSIEYK
jgi:prepilin-type processing-associated H-X9-DG protein